MVQLSEQEPAPAPVAEGSLVPQTLERVLRPGEVSLDELERAFRETAPEIVPAAAPVKAAPPAPKPAAKPAAKSAAKPGSKSSAKTAVKPKV